MEGSMHHKIRKQLTGLAAISLLVAAPCAHAESSRFSKLPLSFESNRGQTSPSVQWLARRPEYTLYLAGSSLARRFRSEQAHAEGGRLGQRVQLLVNTPTPGYPTPTVAALLALFSVRRNKPNRREG